MCEYSPLRLRFRFGFDLRLDAAKKESERENVRTDKLKREKSRKSAGKLVKRFSPVKAHKNRRESKALLATYQATHTQATTHTRTYIHTLCPALGVIYEPIKLKRNCTKCREEAGAGQKNEREGREHANVNAT